MSQRAFPRNRSLVPSPTKEPQPRLLEELLKSWMDGGDDKEHGFHILDDRKQ